MGRLAGHAAPLNGPPVDREEGLMPKQALDSFHHDVSMLGDDTRLVEVVQHLKPTG